MKSAPHSHRHTNDLTVVVQKDDTFNDSITDTKSINSSHDSETGNAGIFLTDIEDMNTRIEGDYPSHEVSPNDPLAKQNSTENNSSSTMSLETNLMKSTQVLRERTIVHEYLCYRTCEYYARLNRATTIPSIVLTGGLMLFNSNTTADECSGSSTVNNLLKGINIAGNSLLTILLSVQTAFKFAEKADYFFNQRKKYTRLHGNINDEIIRHNTVRPMDAEHLKEWSREYNALDENMLYDYPPHIIHTARTKFKNHHMPLVCNSTSVLDNDIPWRKRTRPWRKNNHPLPKIESPTKDMKKINYI